MVFYNLLSQYSLSLSLSLSLHVSYAIDVLPEIHQTRPGADDSTIAPSDVDGQGHGDDQHQGGDSKGIGTKSVPLGQA